MNTRINDYYSQIINILSDPIYNISVTRLGCIEKLFDSTNIYHTDCSSSMLTFPLFDRANNYYSSITTKNIPQVIDVPPIFFIDSFIDISPILVLNSQQSNNIDWTIIHELSHLFSIGQYIPHENNLMQHTFGINQYVYQIEDNKLKVFWCETHNGMNELVTDFVTWHMIQTIYKTKIEPIYKGVRSLYQFIMNNHTRYYTVQDFIGWYFSGNTVQIKKYLLNGLYGDYEKLYSDLEKYY